MKKLVIFLLIPCGMCFGSMKNLKDAGSGLIDHCIKKSVKERTGVKERGRG